MSRRQTLSAFQRELSKLKPEFVRAFQEAVQDIRSTAQLLAIRSAIERGDINAVFQAMRLDREFWAPLDRQINEAFLQGALWQIAQLPKKTGPGGTNLVVRFDQRNPRAEQWTRDRGARLITETTADQQRLVRETVADGIAGGRGAAKIASDLIGTTQGNQRRGGLIGLHSQQAALVRDMRQALSGPGPFGSVIGRDGEPVVKFWIKRDGTLGSKYSKRDKRHDRTILKALREGKALPSVTVDKIARRYADRLLQKRGERIARTQAHNAFSAGRNEAVVQMVESGRIPADAVTGTWQATKSKRTRDTHLAMNGQQVPYGAPFVSPSGAQMMYPGDESLGAPSEELINCRCGVRHEIDFVRLAR